MTGPSAETTPVVTVDSKPSGLPMAMTSWPRLSSLELPSGAAGSVTGASTRTSARSVSGSSPTTRAARLRPSTVVTLTRAAPSTTWLLVSTSPSGATMTPDPVPPWRRSSLVLTSQPHHGGADAVDNVDHGAGIGIEKGLVVRWDRRRRREIGSGLVEHGLVPGRVLRWPGYRSPCASG